MDEPNLFIFRCSSCKHWNPSDSTRRYAMCRRLEGEAKGFFAKILVFSGPSGGDIPEPTFEVASDFGCALWDKRERKPEQA